MPHPRPAGGDEQATHELGGSADAREYAFGMAAVDQQPGGPRPHPGSDVRIAV